MDNSFPLADHLYLVDPSLTEEHRPETLKPASIRETQRLLEKYGGESMILAGGTSMTEDGLRSVRYLIDIGGLGLSYIMGNPDGVHIGASTSLQGILDSPLMHVSPFNVLTEAIQRIPQNVWGRATIGGSICSSRSKDTPVALIALDTRVVIVKVGVSKIIPLSDFFIGDGETALSRREFLKEVYIPKQPETSGAAYVSTDSLRIGVWLNMDADGSCNDAHIVLGTDSTVPLRAFEAEKTLKGQTVTDRGAEDAALFVLEEMRNRGVSMQRKDDYYVSLITQAILEAHKNTA